jgi:hypothetical protein
MIYTNKDKNMLLIKYGKIRKFSSEFVKLCSHVV